MRASGRYRAENRGFEAVGDGTPIAMPRSMRNSALVSRLIFCTTLGFAAYGYAQDLDRASFSAVRQYSPANRPAVQTVTIPQNIAATPGYRALLETMLARSPSFRRQCERIANDRFLTVHLRWVPRRLENQVRAISRISRQSGGRMVADITVDPFDNDVEMIAHEFEHIIEQLDEVNLPEKARRRDSGVHAIRGAVTAFETRRAARMGQTVASEVRHGARRQGGTS